MDFDVALKIARVLSYNKKLRATEDWIMFNCPFARKTHPKGKDDNPSFGINWKDNYYNCFTCGKTGHIATLPFELRQFFPHNEWDWLIELITTKRNQDTRLRALYTMHRPEELPKPLPLELLDYLAPMFFTWKHITPEIARLYGVLVLRDVNIGALQSIYFPIISRKWKLIGIKGRNIHTNKSFYMKSLKGIKIPSNYIKKSGIWYGEGELNEDHSTLYLVEGERDRILLDWWLKENNLSKGFVTIASLGAQLSKAQKTRISRVLGQDEIVVLMDNDEAGQRAAQTLIPHLTKLFKVYVPKKWYGCKDPAEAYEKGVLGDLISKKNLKEVS